MIEIKVKGFFGIEEEHVNVLREALEKATPHERLVVILYFMSDLEDEGFELDNIAKNFEKIYKNDNRSWNNYKGYFIRNHTSGEVFNNTPENDRLWVNIQNRGLWKNSDNGQSKALSFLKNKGIKVYKLQS